MFAVITDEGIVNLTVAESVASESAKHYKNAAVVEVHSLDDIASALYLYRQGRQVMKAAENFVENVSSAFKTASEKLSECGFNGNFADKILTNSDKIVAEVRSLGVKGMKTVGEGFVALGELLRQAENQD